ncbi:hypothetical protein ERO13_A03G052300v2 [Gossypium hirsutum]|nr:hypothetical protein ERO13_A03G052300v2 [Gossypium hirsutum]
MIAVFKISFNLLLPISKGVHLTFSFNLVALVEVSLAYNKRNLELQPTDCLSPCKFLISWVVILYVHSP